MPVGTTGGGFKPIVPARTTAQGRPVEAFVLVRQSVEATMLCLRRLHAESVPSLLTLYVAAGSGQDMTLGRSTEVWDTPAHPPVRMRGHICRAMIEWVLEARSGTGMPWGPYMQAGARDSALDQAIVGRGTSDGAPARKALVVEQVEGLPEGEDL